MHRSFLRPLMILLTLLFIAPTSGCGDRSTPQPVKPAPPPSQTSPLAPPAPSGKVSDYRNTPAVRAAQAVGPAVVGITNKAYARDMLNRKVLVDKGVGSGVIFDARGYIATNNHVVENASELVVSLADGRTVTGTVLGTDPATDLAVVKIDAENLAVATLGDSDSLLVGEPAIAIGNPLGMEFKGTVTAGVISALNRTLDLDDRRFKLIQTDAAINPGNSGGALVNADGLVIGINSAKISAAGVEGISFAIPINAARPVLQSIIEKGRVIRAYMGIIPMDKNTAARYGYELNLDNGVLIYRVAGNAPAARAGLRDGDIIQKIAGQTIGSVVDLRVEMDAQAIGSKVEVIFLRKGQSYSTQVLLEEMPNK